MGSAAPQAAEQDAINFLIAEKAREGQMVARLKWGDPFVFDRGGAEALFLHEQGIAFEVVPGVPALVASPAFAGIPLTYPGGGDTVIFLRGFEDEGRKPSTVDWASLARPRWHDRVLHRPATADARRRVAAVAWTGGRGDRRARGAWHHVGATDHRRAAGGDRGAGAGAGGHRARRPGDWRGRRPARSPALVRQPAVVRTPRAGDTIARAGARAGRAAGTEWRRSDRGAGAPHRAAGGPGAARTRRGQRAIVRLDCLHEHECGRIVREPGRGRRAGPARARGPAPLRRGSWHIVAPAQVRHQSRIWNRPITGRAVSSPRWPTPAR